MKTDASFIEPPIYDGRGSIYVWNQGRWVQRARAYPRDPATQRQRLQRARMGVAGIFWQDQVSPTDKTAWQLYATNTPYTSPRHASITLSGAVMHATVSMLYQNAGRALPNAAPGAYGLASEPAYSIDVTGQTITFTIDPSEPWASSDDGFAVVNMEAPQRASGRNRRGSGAQVGVINGSSGAPIPATWSFTIPWPMNTTAAILTEMRIVDDQGRPNGAGKRRWNPPFEPPPLPPLLECPDTPLDCGTITLRQPQPIDGMCDGSPFPTFPTAPAGDYVLAQVGNAEWLSNFVECIFGRVYCANGVDLPGQTGDGVTWFLQVGDDFNTWSQRYSLVRGLNCPPTGPDAWGDQGAIFNDAYLV